MRSSVNFMSYNVNVKICDILGSVLAVWKPSGTFQKPSGTFRKPSRMDLLVFLCIRICLVRSHVSWIVCYDPVNE